MNNQVNMTEKPRCAAIAIMPPITGKQCTEKSTEVKDGHPVCFTHARREERIAKDGFTTGEVEEGISEKRWAS